MKNKKEIISIALAFILVIASIVTMIIKKELDIKLLILTVIMLIINAGEILIAKHGDSSAEAEREKECNNIINSKVNEKVLNILLIIVTAAIIVGMIAFKITENLYIVAMLVPLLLLYSLVYWYCLRKYKE